MRRLACHCTQSGTCALPGPNRSCCNHHKHDMLLPSQGRPLNQAYDGGTHHPAAAHGSTGAVLESSCCRTANGRKP
eukprot:3923289-Prymnesium_polylepis.1